MGGAKKERVAEGKVRLLSKPSQWMALHFLDLRAAHGALLCILLPSDEGPQRTKRHRGLRCARGRPALLHPDGG